MAVHELTSTLTECQRPLMPQSTTGLPQACGRPAKPPSVGACFEWLAGGGFVQTLFPSLHTTSARNGEGCSQEGWPVWLQANAGSWLTALADGVGTARCGL